MVFNSVTRASRPTVVRGGGSGVKGVRGVGGGERGELGGEGEGEGGGGGVWSGERAWFLIRSLERPDLQQSEGGGGMTGVTAEGG